MLLAVLAGAGGYALGHHAASSADATAARAAAAAASNAADSRLSKAYNDCAVKDTDNTMQLTDNGSTIVVDTRSKYGSVEGVACVFDELKTPSSITAKVDSTTALMGEQSATNDGISYSWSYHPDNGLNMVISLNH